MSREVDCGLCNQVSGFHPLLCSGDWDACAVEVEWKQDQMEVIQGRFQVNFRQQMDRGSGSFWCYGDTLKEQINNYFTECRGSPFEGS